MTWWAISNTPPQFVDGNGDPYSGAVLKFYQDGTTTNTVMATDDTGGTTLTSVALDSNGYPTNASAVFIPHIDQKYKTALYATQAAADADTGAIWTVDNVTAPIIAGTNTDINAKVSSNDTTTGYLNGKLVAGDDITFTEGSDGGNETLTIARTSVVSVVTNHIRSGNMQIIDGSVAYTAFSIDTNVAATFETVGPTGSGATNIWAELDVVPASANAIICGLTLQVTNSDADIGTVTVKAAVNGVTGLNNAGALEIGRLEHEGAAGDEVFAKTQVIIPCDSSQIFQLNYVTSGTATFGADLRYHGFMTD